MGDSPSPLVQRRRLRTELRRARVQAGLTQEQVAVMMDWSLSKCIRIEVGSSNISINDLRALLGCYGITSSETVNSFITLARSARERSWWSKYNTVVPQSLIQLIEYESAAASIKQFQVTLIPEVLQTEDYARVIIEEFYSGRSDRHQASALMELRARRGDLLNGEDSPSCHFVLDEAVVRRLVGRPSIMRHQLRRLIEMMEKPNVAIEIVPFSAGPHPGLRGSFEIVEFTDPEDSDIVFIASPRGDMIGDEVEEIMSYQEAFSRLRNISLDQDSSLDRLVAMIDEFS